MRPAPAIAAILAALAIVLASAGSVLYSRMSAPGPAIRPTLVYIPHGGGFRAFPQKLRDSGLIPSRRLFELAAIATGSASRLQAGEYEVPAQASILDIIRLLRAGRQFQRMLTVPEGLSSAEIVDRLAAEPMLSGPVGAPPAEGGLLPETYAFTRNETRATVLKRMARAHDQAMAELWPHRDRDLPITTPAQAVILASIVERETAKPEERPHIASVYINRLRLGMKLQADPTVAYGVTPGRTLKRALTMADLTTPTAYNTYVITGLPPTPIANPGRAALAATLHPTVSDDLYFVADGSGGHAFSRTLAEHQQNVRRWRVLNGETPSAPISVAKPGTDGPAKPRAAAPKPAPSRPAARERR